MRHISRVVVWLLGAVLAACSGGPAERSVPGAPPPVAVDPARSAAVLHEAFAPLSGGRRLAEVAGVPVTADDIYPLLYLTFHDETREAVRQAVIARLVELEGQRLGLDVPAPKLQAEMERVLEGYDQSVRQNTQGQLGLEEYVPEVFGLSMDEYREWVGRSVTTSLRLERAILHELFRHPRWQVRILRVDREELAAELMDKLERGADFAVLARQFSDDGSREEGGLYPALPMDLEYPLWDAVQDLEPGEFDAVRPVETPDGLRYRLLQLVAKMPPLDGGAAEFKDAVESELDGRVLSPLELDAWMRFMESRYQVKLFGIGMTDG